MRISVIIPSRLDRALNGRFWVERALTSVLQQTFKPIETILALDDGVTPPANDGVPMDYTVINWKGRGHQGAMNEAVRRSVGTHVTFLEDDDWWLPRHLETCASLCETFPFIGHSQLQHRGGRPWDILDFPTASGWCVSRKLWDEMGGVNESYTIHHDNELLCRIRASKVRNAHVVDRLGRGSKWLQAQVQRRATMVVCPHDELQVQREVHESSIMGQVYTKKDRAAVSRREKDHLISIYGDEGY